MNRIKPRSRIAHYVLYIPILMSSLSLTHKHLQHGLHRVTHGRRSRQGSGKARKIPKLSASVQLPVGSNLYPHSDSLFTPLNAILVSAVLYAVYSFFRGPVKPEIRKALAPVDFKTYTPRTLLPLNGEANNPVYLAVRGKIFDVTSGRNFYGPGDPYANFAGRDASRGLACGRFDEEMLTGDLDGLLDTLEDLTADQMEALEGWEARFNDKYDVVGRLVSVADLEAQEK